MQNPTKIDFFGRGKPAEIVSAVIFDIKGSFGEIVFRSYGLQDFIGQPRGEWTYRSRISLE